MLADMVWSKVLTILKAKLSVKWKTLSYTTSDMNKKQPTLPNLFINQVDAPSTGDDLEHNRQNAIVSVIQLEVSSNTSLDEARKIMDAAGDVMISKGYSVISGPSQANTSVYRTVARYRRAIANDDVF